MERYAINITDDAPGSMLTLVEFDPLTQSVTLMQEGVTEKDPNDHVVLSIPSLKKFLEALLAHVNDEEEIVADLTAKEVA